MKGMLCVEPIHPKCDMVDISGNVTPNPERLKDRHQGEVSQCVLCYNSDSR